MHFEDIIGQEFIKKHLMASVDDNRVAHAQLFVGISGSGILPMAIAFAQYVLCNTPQTIADGTTNACSAKFKNLSHPDLHFAFPVATNQIVKKHPVSTHFAREWREFLKKNPYGSLMDWHRHIDIEKKQGQIGVDEALEIVRSLSLKSYEGGFKIMIIWRADKMNTAASNKLLKLLEEPQGQTLFLLLAESEDGILDTIKSRCQLLNFPPLSEAAIAEALEIREDCAPALAQKIAHQSNGDYNNALHLMHNDGDDEEFEGWFIAWVRAAFMAKGNKKAVRDLLSWSEQIAGKGRETQKDFLDYCVDFFRQALMLNYKLPGLVFIHPNNTFDLSKFAPFIHGSNIGDIVHELHEANYHIARNGNAKIIFTDLSIKLTRLLHRKAA